MLPSDDVGLSYVDLRYYCRGQASRSSEIYFSLKQPGADIIALGFILLNIEY